MATSDGIIRMFMRMEAEASVALDRDGTTTVLSAWKPPRERPGFGCPHCGTPLDLEHMAPGVAVDRGLPCCGYMPTADESWRWLRARRLIRG